MQYKAKFYLERGFTLIELLVTFTVIGVLAAISVANFSQYRAGAAYASAVQTLNSAQTVLNAQLVEDAAYAGFTAVTQNSAGPITDAAMGAIFRQLILPTEVSITASYDPTCDTGACQAAYIEVHHCKGQEYVSWSRFGDGVEIRNENIAGVGC